MNQLSLFLSQWTQEGLSPGVLNELGWLLLALVLAWLIVRQLGRQALPTSVLFGRQLVDGLLFPAVALGLVYVGQLWLGKQQPLILLKLAVPPKSGEMAPSLEELAGILYAAQCGVQRSTAAE